MIESVCDKDCLKIKDQVWQVVLYRALVIIKQNVFIESAILLRIDFYQLYYFQSSSMSFRKDYEQTSDSHRRAYV